MTQCVITHNFNMFGVMFQILKCRFSKKISPSRIIKVRDLISASCHRCKSIVEDNMVLLCDSASSKIQHKRDRTRIAIRETNKHTARTAGLPPRKLHTTSDRLVHHINWIAPHMSILETMLRPSSLRATFEVGNVIPNEDSI